MAFGRQLAHTPLAQLATHPEGRGCPRKDDMLLMCVIVIHRPPGRLRPTRQFNLSSANITGTFTGSGVADSLGEDVETPTDFDSSSNLWWFSAACGRDMLRCFLVPQCGIWRSLALRRRLGVALGFASCSTCSASPSALPILSVGFCELVLDGFRPRVVPAMQRCASVRQAHALQPLSDSV